MNVRFGANRALTLIAGVTCLSLAVTRATAQVQDTADIFENGVALLNGSALRQIPGDSTTPPGWFLPLAVNDADVIVTEFGHPNVISDVLRFTTDVNGRIIMQLWSDNSDGSDDLADVGIPTLQANTFTIGEDATGLADFTLDQNRYLIHSDGDASVPEPGALALLTGLAVPGAWFLRRRR